MSRLPGIKTVLQTTWKLVRLLYIHIALSFLFLWIVDLVLIVPSATFLLDRFINYSGSKAIGNFDIVIFLFTPVGAVFVILSVIVFVVALMFQVSALMLLAHGGVSGQNDFPVGVLKQLFKKSISIFKLALGSVLLLFIVTIPMALIVIFLQKQFLSTHDINYYLSIQPLQYWLAVIVAIAAIMTAVVFYSSIIISVAFALPNVLFTDSTASQALKKGYRKFKPILFSIILLVVKFIFLWFIPALIINLIIYVAGGVLIRLSGTFMTLLLPAVELTLGLNLIAGTLFGYIGLSLIAFLIYMIWYQIEYGKPVCIDNRVKPPVSGRRVLFSVSIAAIAAAVFAGNLLLNTLEIEDRVLIIAHRGSAATAPENTLSALRKSIKDGADMVEIDIQLTKDGKVVLWHDKDAMRISGKGFVISETAYDTLETLDAGSWFSDKFTGERVATLEEAVETGIKGNISLLLELKNYGDERDLLLDSAVSILQKYNFTGKAAIMSLKHEEVRRVEQYYPEMEAGFIVSAVIGDLTLLDEDFLILSKQLATDSTISALHAAEKRVFVWTIDDVKTMSRLVNQGVDGIITNVPDKLKALLESRAALSPAQILLLRFGELYSW